MLTELVLNFYYLKLKLGVFLTGYRVAMVTYYLAKITIPCSRIIRHLFNTIIDVLTDKSSVKVCPKKCRKPVPATLISSERYFKEKL